MLIQRVTALKLVMVLLLECLPGGSSSGVSLLYATDYLYTLWTRSSRPSTIFFYRRVDHVQASLLRPRGGRRGGQGSRIRHRRRAHRRLRGVLFRDHGHRAVPAAGRSQPAYRPRRRPGAGGRAEGGAGLRGSPDPRGGGGAQGRPPLRGAGLRRLAAGERRVALDGPESGRTEVALAILGGDSADMQGAGTRPTVPVEVAQGTLDGGKGELLPGNLLLLEQRHLQALRAGREGPGQLGAEDHEHLVDMRQADHGVEPLERHLGAGLLPGLPGGGLAGGLGVLHEARRQSPVAQPRGDGATAEQHPGAAHRRVPATIRGFW